VITVMQENNNELGGPCLNHHKIGQKWTAHDQAGEHKQNSLIFDQAKLTQSSPPSSFILYAGGDTNLYGYVGTVGKPGIETNLYGYSFSDPINFIDINGLSAEDVNQIKSKFRDVVDSMTRNGVRHPNPYWNNWRRGLSDITNGNLGNPHFLGCYEQASETQRLLESLKYDDVWTFSPKNNLFHHWIEGRSSNPNDPVLTIDPWRDVIRER